MISDTLRHICDNKLRGEYPIDVHAETWNHYRLHFNKAYPGSSVQVFLVNSPISND
jgi:hypothetical protein